MSHLHRQIARVTKPPQSSQMLIVDGRIAFTGGINISEVYASGFGSSGRKISQESWRDTDIEIEGPSSWNFSIFSSMSGNIRRGPPLCSCNYFPTLERQGNQIVRVIGSVPERFSLIYATLISAIVNPATNVYITDAYFAPVPTQNLERTEFEPAVPTA
jgi:cardiolipin synthase